MYSASIKNIERSVCMVGVSGWSIATWDKLRVCLNYLTIVYHGTLSSCIDAVECGDLATTYSTDMQVACLQLYTTDCSPCTLKLMS